MLGTKPKFATVLTCSWEMLRARLGIADPGAGPNSRTGSYRCFLGEPGLCWRSRVPEGTRRRRWVLVWPSWDVSPARWAPQTHPTQAEPSAGDPTASGVKRGARSSSLGEGGGGRRVMPPAKLPIDGIGGASTHSAASDEPAVCALGGSPGID